MNYKNLTQKQGYELIEANKKHAKQLINECIKIAEDLDLSFRVSMINHYNTYESKGYSKGIETYFKNNPHVNWDNYDNLTDAEKEYLENNDELGGGSGYHGWQSSGC